MQSMAIFFPQENTPQWEFLGLQSLIIVDSQHIMPNNAISPQVFVSFHTVDTHLEISGEKNVLQLDRKTVF